MINLILTDFDGTLFLNSRSELSKEFITKIKNLTDCGTIFAINSGRSYDSLKRMVKELENRTLFICNDGTQMMYKNCLLFKDTINKESAREIFKKAMDLGFSPFASLRENNKPVNKEVLSSPALLNEDIYKIILIKNNANDAYIDQIKDLAYKNNLRTCYEDKTYLEFCNKTANKGVATQFVKKKFGITKNVASFGDGENDIPMFKASDMVFIVKNANHLDYPNAKIIDNVQEYIINNF